MQRNKTREQRRMRRRLYRLMVTILLAMVVALVLSTIQYGAYVQNKVRSSAPTWIRVEAIDPSDQIPVEVLAQASARYEYERDPVLYAMLLPVE